MTTVDTGALRRALDGRAPAVLLTLGSGLGALAEQITDAVVVPFDEVGLPTSTVSGHAGRLVAGDLAGVPVLAQQGRVHLYEGRDPRDVTACVRAAAEVGVSTFVVTNAAGGLDPGFEPGDLMLITDHLNMTGTSPLLGITPATFLDMAAAYDPASLDAAREAASDLDLRLREGVYAGLLGPAYETPAEVAMLRALGADAVGMSTVLEVIAARASGLAVLGFSSITNVHRPGGTPTDHAEVLEVGRDVGARLARLLEVVLPRLVG